MPPNNTSSCRWSITLTFILLSSLKLAYTPAFAQAYIGSPPAITRVKREKPEPPLIVEWHKTPEKSLDLFDGSLETRPKLVDDPFQTPPDAVPFTERQLCKNDPFSLGTLEPKVKPIMYFATTHVRKGGYKYFPRPDPSTFGDAFSASFGDSDTFHKDSDEDEENPITAPRASDKGKIVLQGYTRKEEKQRGFIPPIRKTLHDIWLIESDFQPTAKTPTTYQKLQLKRLYTRAAQLEPHEVLKTYYRFMADISTENLDGAWREIEIASRQSPGNVELFESFAEEFDYLGLPYDYGFLKEADASRVPNLVAVHREWVAGKEAFEKHQWQSARLHYNRLHQLIPKSVGFTKSIANEYKYYEEGKADARIWLTRLINIATDKETIANAKEAREWLIPQTKTPTKTPVAARKETSVAARKGEQTSAHWNAAKFPLKVYFAYQPLANGLMNKDDAAIRAASLEALKEWSLAAQGKIDFVEVRDEKSANIVCERKKRSELLKIPARLRWEDWVPPEHVAGATFPNQNDQNEITFARILFYKDRADKINIKNVAAHELGHALGMLQHSKSVKDIMYDSIRGPSRDKPTAADIAYIRSLYKDHPVSLTGEAKYLGLPAVCEKL